tara:strand:- start:2432 stop:3919 length:1488 start_codon:yes stop_codon:yes gene_type:complete
MTNKTAIVIGGGLGGLACALSLRGKGFEVKLFEKNSHLGGKLNYLEKGGFRFDLGPSIFTMPHIFEDLFSEIGESLHDWLTLIPLDPQWKNFFPDHSSFYLYQNKEKMKQELQNFNNGKDTEGWFRYLAYCDEQLKFAEEGYLGEGLDSFWNLLRFYGFRKSFFGIDWRASMSGKIGTFVKDPRVQAVLEYFIKYVGSSAINAPSMMGLLFAMQIRYGLWYVKGGMFELSRAMTEVAKKIGVETSLNTDVQKILHKDNRAIGIETNKGTRFFADAVICNQEVSVARNELIDYEKSRLSRSDRTQAPSCSGLVIHLGTRKHYPQLAHHNFFYSKDQKEHFQMVFDEGRLPEDPTLYVVAPSRTDLSVCPEGYDNIKILPHIPPLKDSDERINYEELRDRVLNKLESMGLSSLKNNIVVEETWTPYDIREKYRSKGGSIYGVVSDRWKNQGIKAPKRSKDYRGLYFVGGSVNPGSGMPMVVLGGKQTAEIVAQECYS